MAEIVLGIGTSHGPMLSTPWEKWGGRVAADKQLGCHDFRGGAYSFDELVELRSEEQLAEQITPERWQERSAACEVALEAARRLWHPFRFASCCEPLLAILIFVILIYQIYVSMD